MENSSQMKKLPIISILEGEQEGIVESLLINPAGSSVDFVIFKQEEWQKSMKAIPFEKVIGIGGYAVTIENADSIIDLKEILIAGESTDKKIAALDTNVITRKGDLLGKVLGFYINKGSGKIIGLNIKLKDAEAIVLSEYVMTYGKQIIIVKEDAANNLKKTLGKNEEEIHEIIEQKENELLEDYLKMPANNEEELRLQALKEKQIELLLNKKVTKDVYSDEGTLLFAEGKVLSLEDIRSAQDAGPSIVIQLSMSVKA
ncbi:photosystem reaction center subunit H [Niallia sp. NCCP-28]|uniref:PRC-barrel domain-containing protein n=1 Tax=Niallia sp. NCCP-28 TaxID=2934712 RepID=UPI0020805EA0|nr:photosystem reaction center subunit H [Niallia sp. NCCP-28]GKU81450.1 hypothetical protein NCCP28_08460 [Niallia sp. NCCP-28]